MTIWFDEHFENKIRFGARVKRILFNDKSAFQKVTIIDTEALGKALLIDDLWMCAQEEEATYHEMITHVPMQSMANVKRVLIIGGGDGGTAREVLKYPSVEHIDLVEIDAMVVDACKRYLPEMAGGAWDDPRLFVHIADGVSWVKDASNGIYDVILVDGSDPVGPAVGLFNADFYRACYERLADDGVLVTQAESPKLFFNVHIDLLQTLSDIFPVVAPYYQSILIYAGALWAWAYASKKRQPQIVDLQSAHAIAEHTHLYNVDIHQASFAVPNFVKRKFNR